ncbi:MAG: hypothetical protein P8P21_01360 [Paracoccaceae bacterium]|nr:hypothetical protein [Paracoccaceae bacterium]
MRKIPILAIWIYLFFTTSALPDTMFGFKLNSNITDNINADIVAAQSYRYKEQKGNLYFELDVSDLMEDQQKSVYFSEYFITFDKYNKVHEIVALLPYQDKARCPLVGAKIVENFEKQFNLKMEEGDKAYFPQRDMYFVFDSFHKNRNYDLGVYCNFYHDDKTSEMLVFLSSKQLSTAVNSYYSDF